MGKSFHSNEKGIFIKMFSKCLNHWEKVCKKFSFGSISDTNYEVQKYENHVFQIQVFANLWLITVFFKVSL